MRHVVDVGQAAQRAAARDLLAVLIAHAANRHSALTVWGAHLYFWGRVAYLPLYAMGIPRIRTVAWTVATLGIILILIALI